MMLSKMTWIAFFGALCFRSSESISTEVCDNDRAWRAAMTGNRLGIVPILITNNQNPIEDQNMINHFTTLDKAIKINVHRCIEAVGFMNADGPFPQMFIMHDFYVLMGHSVSGFKPSELDALLDKAENDPALLAFLNMSGENLTPDHMKEWGLTLTMNVTGQVITKPNRRGGR